MHSLRSLVSARNGNIHYLFSQLLFSDDLAKLAWRSNSISHHAHLEVTRGLVGVAAGLAIQKHKYKKKTFCLASGDKRRNLHLWL
jgi:hypothetical protein